MEREYESMFGSPFWPTRLFAESAIGGAAMSAARSRDRDRDGGLPAAARDAAAMGEEAQRRRRDCADGLLYDLKSLDPRSREALKTCAPGAVLVAHPEASRPIAVYADVERLALSLDRGARVLALASPGSSAEAAAALTRRTADALGEPVVGLAPPRALGDLVLDLAAPLGRREPTSAARSGLAELLGALRRDFELIVAHRLGGCWLSAAGCGAGTRIVTIGGAAEPGGPRGRAASDGRSGLVWLVDLDLRATGVARRGPFAGGISTRPCPTLFRSTPLFARRRRISGFPDPGAARVPHMVTRPSP